MRWLAIINPKAGRRTEAQLQQFAHELEEKVDAFPVWTVHPNHIHEIVRQHPDYHGFIAVGGDGTISEVVNALTHDCHCLGIFPAGTGNSVARDLALHDHTVALQALQWPRFDLLDLVSVRWHAQHAWRQRWMLNTSAIGYIADTTDLSCRQYKSLGAWGQSLAAVLQAFRQQEFTLRLRLDGASWQELPLTNLVIQNTQHISAFRLFPEARMDDGQVDVLYGHLPGVTQLIEDVGVLTKSYFCEQSVRCQAAQVEVELRHPALLMIDGEMFENVDAVHYQVQPGKLSCCTGESQHAIRDQAHRDRPAVAEKQPELVGRE